MIADVANGGGTEEERAIVERWHAAKKRKRSPPLPNAGIDVLLQIAQQPLSVYPLPVPPPGYNQRIRILKPGDAHHARSRRRRSTNDVRTV